MRAAVAIIVLTSATAAAAPFEDWWVGPFERVRVTLKAIDEESRPYDTVLRPRDLTVGGVALSCEHIEGEPCGDGYLAYGDVDSRAGYGRWVTLATRIRVQTGTSVDTGIGLDRAHLDLHLGSLSAEVGRDALRFGPSVRTQLGWGNNAPPLDHVRLSSAAPFMLGRDVEASLEYVVGRLRAPQRYPGALVTIGRGELDVGHNVELGIIHMLQLEGEGAPHLGPWDFIAEHFRRKDLSASDTDTSNRRFGGDISGRIHELSDMRLYYVLVFEDIRLARFIDALRYDADHLFGLQIPHLVGNEHYGLLVEYQQTGVRSQEHHPRTTGFTNAGHLVGSPLGPDAQSFYIGGSIRLQAIALVPWLELVRIGSDTYSFVNYGPITPVKQGEDEGRYRAGIEARASVRPNVMLEVGVMAEHVDDFAFQPHVRRNNAAATLSVVWYPSRPLGTLDSI